MTHDDEGSQRADKDDFCDLSLSVFQQKGRQHEDDGGDDRAQGDESAYRQNNSENTQRDSGGQGNDGQTNACCGRDALAAPEAKEDGESVAENGGSAGDDGGELR